MMVDLWLKVFVIITYVKVKTENAFLWTRNWMTNLSGTTQTFLRPHTFRMEWDIPSTIFMKLFAYRGPNKFANIKINQTDMTGLEFYDNSFILWKMRIPLTCIWVIINCSFLSIGRLQLVTILHRSKPLTLHSYNHP